MDGVGMDGSGLLFVSGRVALMVLTGLSEFLGVCGLLTWVVWSVVCFYAICLFYCWGFFS